MINIIKDGVIKPKTRTIYKATCDNCGCIFEFETEDIKSQEKRLDGNIFIDCPYCSQTLKLNHNDLESREEEITYKKLRDITFEGDRFSIHSNRFYVFDKDGYELNTYALLEYPNFLDLEVLDTCISSYIGYSVGFDTIHIKVDLEHGVVADTCGGFKYGDKDERL